MHITIRNAIETVNSLVWDLSPNTIEDLSKEEKELLIQIQLRLNYLFELRFKTK